MNARFTFRYDVDYLMTAFERHRAQHWSRHLSSVMMVLALMFTAVYVYRAFERQQLFAVLVGAAIFVAIFVSRALMRRLLRWRMSRIRGLGDGFVIEISSGGMYAKGLGEEATVPWNRFARAVRYADGFLLVQGPHVFNWLPLDALAAGCSAEEAHTLIEDGIGRIAVRAP